MDNIKDKITEIRKKIDAMSVRERVILTATLVTGVWILCIVALIEPLMNARTEHQKEISSMNLEKMEAESTLKILKIEYSVDPNKKPRERLRELTHQLRRIEGDIQNKSQHLVPASKTAKVLQEMLETQTGLYLSSLEKLEPVAVPIIDGDPADSKNQDKSVAEIAQAIQSQDLDHVKALMAVVQSSDPFLNQLENQTAVYKHGVKMELQGQFLDVLEYLVALEKMNWKVYWKSFHYTTDAYPVGKASFVIETLGFENGWIGV